MTRFAVLAFALGLVPLPAAALGDRTELSCSALVESDVIDSSIRVICGIEPETVARMMEAAVSGREGDYGELKRWLDAMTPADARLTSDSVASFFAILERDQVPPEQLTDRLAEITQRHLQLEAELGAFRVDDPDIQALVDRAQAALAAAPPDHGAALAALAEARALRRERREATEAILAEHRREEAEIVRLQAGQQATLLNRVEAARLFTEAADLLPDSDVDQKWSDLFDAASALREHGDLKGDNAALARAIGLWARMLTIAPRGAHADRWATTQNNLGNALATLGARESGTAWLEEAVAAYRAALEETTRERAPLDWAMTLTNLGAALQTLGERESGTARLEEAVAAYRAALEERTRERAPLDWAMTQTNLAIALATLAERAGQPRDAALAEIDAALEVFRAAGAEAYVEQAVGIRLWIAGG
jgi:hypothetical protein